MKADNSRGRLENVYDWEEKHLHRGFSEKEPLLFILLIFVILLVFIPFVGLGAWVLLAQVMDIGGILTFSSFLTMMGVAGTLALVLVVYLQVLKEKEYLENFEPSLKLYERDSDGASVSKADVRNQEKVEGWFVAFNPSQTAALITGAELREAPDTHVRPMGLGLERAGKVKNETDHYGNVPVEDNSGILFKFRIKEDDWDAKNREVDQLLEQEYMTIVVKGNFEEEEFKVDVRE